MLPSKVLQRAARPKQGPDPRSAFWAKPRFFTAFPTKYERKPEDHVKPRQVVLGLGRRSCDCNLLMAGRAARKQSATTS